MNEKESQRIEGQKTEIREVSYHTLFYKCIHRNAKELHMLPWRIQKLKGLEASMN